MLSGVCVSGLSEAPGFLLQMEMASLFAEHKNWPLNVVKFMWWKEKEKKQEEIKMHLAFCLRPSMMFSQSALNLDADIIQTF